MWFTSWPRYWKRQASPRKQPAFRPTLEALEDRWVPSTLIVRNNLDSAAGSLRAEIAAAHSGDTIIFAPSLDGQTITLTSGQLIIKKNLTIAGPGAGQLTISGNHASRVFEVAKMENVSLSGLTISNAYSGTSGYGGAIETYGTLTVSNSALAYNSAFAGGGIYNHASGTLMVSNSILSNDTATNAGGGINNDGTVTVSGSTLSGNSAQQIGGGIANGGTLTVSGSILSGNSANHGGGIWNDGTAMVSGGSTLLGNSTTSGTGVGGGIYNIRNLTVSDSTLSRNSGEVGGGIYNLGTLTVSASNLSGNTANNDGGGIENYGTLTVSGSTLSANVAAYRGGGIANFGTATVENSSSITGNSAPLGFGADVYNHFVLNLDSISTIGILDGNAAVPI
ncbi:MAG: hypothetical protein ACJ8FY_08120 [Gemmataceae bacterium]